MKGGENMKGNLHTLSDMERKLLIIIQHENHKGKSPSLSFLHRRTGRSEEEIQMTIKKLVKLGWLMVRDKQLLVVQPIF